MKKLRVGFALTGSFCTFDQAVEVLRRMVEIGWEVLPIMSYNAYELDTKFGKAQHFIDTIEEITGRSIIHTIPGAEPIGPGKLTDIMVVAPCTGNTLAKLAVGIADTPVTMACKSHLRNGLPLVLAVSTNDALGGAAKNIGALMNYKNLYFVPMAQDDTVHKPRSIVADFDRIIPAIEAAAEGRQVQPLYTNH